MKFRIIIEQDEDGVFVAHCPTLPGCISQGHSLRAARANIKEAIAGYMESLAKHGETENHPYLSCEGG
jgi:antitoxin HicB